MNYREYDFSKTDLQKLKSDCETVPFFSNKRLIVINDVNLSKDGVSTHKVFLMKCLTTYKKYRIQLF